MTATENNFLNASIAIQTAQNVESWMLEADTEQDRDRTAYAIANAALETLEDLDMSLAAYADGFAVPVHDLRAMRSAMLNVMAWCVATMA